MFTMTYIGVKNTSHAAHLRGTNQVRESQFSQLPSFVKFNKDAQPDLESLKQWMASNFKFNPNVGFQLLRQEPDQLGHIHYRYQQTFNGTPVEDAIWIVHTNAGKVYSMNGLIYENLLVGNTPSLSATEALEKAKAFVGADVYKWELAGEEQHLKWETGNNEATYMPEGELVFAGKNGDFSTRSVTLAYKFNIYAHQPLYRAEVYVDATTGEIIRENKLIHHVDEPGTAHTAYSGEQEIVADSFDGGYRLRDHSRGDGVRTFDMNEGMDYGSSVDFLDDDNTWDNVTPDLDEYATDAHWGAEVTYDYYFDVHGRNSLDNDGFQLNSYVHYSTSFVNAFWDGSRMTYGDGDGGTYSPLTTLDIAGHEVTHGLTNFTANLVYADESGALNESFSDIFGNAIERFARPDDWDWLMGTEIGEAFRSMSNPNEYGHPDTYFGDMWAPLGGPDNGGVHSNSGVQNFWFYLLTEGGTGTNDNGDDYEVEALGIEAASAIAFRNLTVYLTPSSQFADARFYAIQSAVDLYGGCTNEVEQTTNAWYAVGVGDLYTTEVIANFIPSDTEGCEVPFTVTFSNTSVNGVDFTWNFGDGGTSTETSPTHTYTEEGTFDVTLTVDGGDCGEDDTVMVGAIVVDSDLDCPVILPTSGTAPVQNSCEGTLFDSGGADGEYANGENNQITIAPDGAATVTLEFVVFDIEDGGPTCIYDYLRVYDGASTGDPEIGTFCNGSPPETITSTGSAITLQFVSDGLVTEGGFEINWSCTTEIDDTGIGESGSEIIQIFPNPTHGKLTINTHDLTAGTIEINNLLGQQLITLPITKSLTEYDFSSYNTKGIYLVHIKDSKGNLLKVEKVVVH